jgi:hypothetical protein
VPILQETITLSNKQSEAIDLFKHRTTPYKKGAVRIGKNRVDREVEAVLGSIEQLHASIQQQSHGHSLTAVNPSIAKRLFGTK